MAKVLIFLIVGIAIGSFLNLDEKKIRMNSRFQFFGLMLLLFLMGSTIGMDRSLLLDIKNLGIEAFTYAASATFLSIFFVYYTSKIFFERR